MTPNWEAFEQAIAILIVATPFMFGVLAVFAGATYLSTKVGGG